MFSTPARMARVILSAIILTAVVPGMAQVKSTKFEGSYIANNKIMPIAKGRMAFASSDWEGVYISTYDSTSALVWEKDYTVPQERTRIDRFVSSANGNDIWVLSTYEEYLYTKPLKQIDVSWIDAISGDSKTKSFPFPEMDFGFVYSTWANSKYLFVMTTAHRIYNSEIANEPGVRVYRFDKSTLAMTKLDHDMERPTKFTNVFWEVLRVEEEFVEAYVVTSAGRMIEIKFGRFDNNGKEVSVASSEFMIKEADHFTRQVHGYCSPGPGIGESNHSYQMYSSGNGVTIELIYPMSSVQVAYCAKTQTYYATGMIGPEEQKRLATVYDGFFLAKLNSKFEVEKYKEYIDVPVFESDRNFEIHAGPDGHHIQCYFDPAGNPVVQMGSEKSYLFTIDQSDLALTKSIEIEQENYQTVGSVLNAGSNWLVADPIAEEEQGKYNMFGVLVSGNWQYALKQNYNSGDITVFTKKVK